MKRAAADHFRRSLAFTDDVTAAVAGDEPKTTIGLLGNDDSPLDWDSDTTGASDSLGVRCSMFVVVLFSGTSDTLVARVAARRRGRPSSTTTTTTTVDAAAGATTAARKSSSPLGRRVPIVPGNSEVVGLHFLIVESDLEGR